jgi:hypothetical protein
MPTREHLVLCGGQNRRGSAGARVLRLNLQGPSPNVRLQITDISKRLVANIPDVLVDLLEIASYVYAADSGISRGGEIDAQMGARWRRKFRLAVPVRCPNLWHSSAVSSALVDTLSFLSDDEYAFEFATFDERQEFQSYLGFSGADVDSFSPDEVILFSGGLDSFAGSIEELVANGKSIALVSHRSATKMASGQIQLIDELRKRVSANRILCIPVWATLDKTLGTESTHRTRSFLYATLGCVTARLFNLDRIKFFENCVMSLNLPPVAQVVGARVSQRSLLPLRTVIGRREESNQRGADSDDVRGSSDRAQSERQRPAASGPKPIKTAHLRNNAVVIEVTRLCNSTRRWRNCATIF